jgi:hypothetical protein
MKQLVFTLHLEAQLVLASQAIHQQELEHLSFLLLVLQLVVQLRLVYMYLHELQVLLHNQASLQYGSLPHHEMLPVQEMAILLSWPFTHISELLQLVVLELQIMQSFTPTLELVTAQALRRQATPP